MKQLEPVIWTKGTLLNPQHFQMQDRFIESNLQFQLDVLAFRPWGFSRFRIDQEALVKSVGAGVARVRVPGPIKRVVRLVPGVHW